MVWAEGGIHLTIVHVLVLAGSETARPQTHLGPDLSSIWRCAVTTSVACDRKCKSAGSLLDR